MQNRRSLYKHKLLTIVSLCLLVFSWSCQKGDDIKPVINVDSPKGGHFSVLDTIKVSASISDNENIVSVRIRLTDMDYRQACRPYTYSVNAKSYSLNANYIIDDLYLESGEYYLIIEADDGVNISKAFISIQIGAIDRQLDDVLIVEKEDAKTSIYSIMSGQKELVKVFNQTYLDFVYNPYSKQYLFLSSNGVLTAYDQETLELKWQVQDLKDPSRNYSGRLVYKDNLVYVNHYLGSIQAYNTEGKIVKQANTVDNNGQISDYMFAYDKIMAFKQPYTEGNYKIEELNEISGASVYTYDISFSAKKIVFVDEDLCLVFGNEYNKAKACSLSTLYNTVQPFGDFGERELGDAHRYSKYYYILSLDKEILEYNLSNGNERILETCEETVPFFYENLYDKLYFIEQNKIYNLAFPATGSSLFYTNNKDIDDLIFVYNK